MIDGDDNRPRTRILVCDDEVQMLELLQRYLSRRGFEVHAVIDGVEACEAARALSPDVILLDLDLPRRDGYTVLLNLKGEELTREIPVVIFSGEPKEVHENLALSLGASAFVQKPYEVTALVELLDGVAAGNAGSSSVVGG